MAIQSTIIEYDQDGDSFEGHLAWDDGSAASRPCVIVSHAWGGLGEFERGRANALAELGYAAFCLDLYGKGIRGDNPQENAKLIQPFLEDRALLQRRMNLAVAVAGRQDIVDPGRMAAIGYCFGGLCVLDLARVGGSVLGVASFHGLFGPPGNTDGNEITAKVLALHGWDDPMATPEAAVALGVELTAAGADWQLHAYGNTVHAFTNPQANNPDGGTVYSAAADRRSWRALVDFLEELF